MRKNQEIQNELQELSSELAKIPFTQVYEAPDGYFDQFPISILKNAEEDVKLDIPDDYFEKLPDEILYKIHATSNVISINKKNYYFKIAVAAVIVGLLGIGLVYFLNNKKADTPPSFVKNIDSSEKYNSLNSNNLDVEINKLNEDELISYLEDNGHDVNAALVASLVEDNSQNGNHVTETQVDEEINEIQIKK
jgi:hypothetical protein